MEIVELPLNRRIQRMDLALPMPPVTSPVPVHPGPQMLPRLHKRGVTRRRGREAHLSGKSAISRLVSRRSIQ